MNARDAAALDRHITGNYGEDQIDAAWERVHEEIDDDAQRAGLFDQDALAAWKMGLAAFSAASSRGARFPHG